VQLAVAASLALERMELSPGMPISEISDGISDTEKAVERS
jgi:hypothetical protein